MGVSGTEWKDTWTILSCMIPFGPTVGGATSSVRLTVVVEGVVEGKGFKDGRGRAVGEAVEGGGFDDGVVAVVVVVVVVVVVLVVAVVVVKCCCCCCCCCCCWLRDDLRLARWPCVCGCVCVCVCDGVCVCVCGCGCVCPPSRCIMLPCGLFSPRP